MSTNKSLIPAQPVWAIDRVLVDTTRAFEPNVNIIAYTLLWKSYASRESVLRADLKGWKTRTRSETNRHLKRVCGPP